MCIRDRAKETTDTKTTAADLAAARDAEAKLKKEIADARTPVSYTHLRAHETVLDLVCRLLLDKKKKRKYLTT